jgi:HPt (histidine-containing phosphotransfer) domain-containing protein
MYGCGNSTEARPLNDEAGRNKSPSKEEAANDPTIEAAKLTKEEVYASANLATFLTFDEDMAQEQVNGDIEILQELHTMVCEQYHPRFEKGDYQRVHSAAHALKGAMCNLGANRFASISALLENYGHKLKAILKTDTALTEDQTHLVRIYIQMMADEWQEYLNSFQDFLKRTTK